MTSTEQLNSTQWKPGQSGNPSGRPRGVVYPGDLIPGLLSTNADGSPRMTKAKLQEICDDPETGISLDIAARWLIDSATDGHRWGVDKTGKLVPLGMDPVPSRVREALSDRLEGKPVVRLQIADQPTKTLEQYEDDFVGMFEQNPTMLACPEAWAMLLPRLELGGPLLERLRPLLLSHAPTLLEQADAKVSEWRRKCEACPPMVVKSLPAPTDETSGDDADG